MARVAMARYCC